MTEEQIALERSAFEWHWYEFYHGSIHARHDGKYFGAVQFAWVAWLARAAQPRQGVELTFEQAWAEKEAQGYNYGEDALENVRLGFYMARANDTGASNG